MEGLPEWMPVKARVVRAGRLSDVLEKCGVDPCIAVVPIGLVKEAAGKGCRPPGGHVYLVLEGGSKG